MPKPPTYTDTEMREMVISYYLNNNEFPTIAQVKKMGCGDSRAQRILKEVKSSEGYDVQSQPQPQPQSYPPEPVVIGGKIVCFQEGGTWVNIDELPPWMTKRILNYIGGGEKH